MIPYDHYCTHCKGYGYFKSNSKNSIDNKCLVCDGYGVKPEYQISSKLTTVKTSYTDEELIRMLPTNAFSFLKPRERRDPNFFNQLYG